MISLILAILLLALTLCSGVFSGSETALFSLSPMKIRSFKGSNDKRRQLIARLLMSPRDLLVTIMMFNVLVNILAQNVASNLFGESGTWALVVGVPFILTLILGEIIPKSIALPNNERIAYAVSPLITRLKGVTAPVRKLITRWTSTVTRVMFFFLKGPSKTFQKMSSSTYWTAHAPKGLLSTDEAKLIDGFLEVRDSCAKELMRPRQEVIYYDLHDPLDSLYSTMTEKEVTRLPVCDGDLQNIQGVLTARLLLLYRNEIDSAADLKPFLRKPFFVPESAPATGLFRQMVEKAEQMAVVVDEYGAVSGIVTREDIVEEVVGQIKDQRDEKQLWTRTGKNVIIASGKMELDTFKEIFGIELDSESNVVTIGGWLTEALGHIPKTGEHFTTERFLFHVLASNPNRVRRIYIRFLEKEPS